MIEHGMYFGKSELYSVIQEVGGQWNDSKERPIVCMLKFPTEDIYWAIPVGNWEHRNMSAKNRILSFVNRSSKDLGSCYYHIGKTDVTSVFFISDVIPISEKYIEREYLSKYTKKIHIIKNKELLSELERKLKRILSWENANPNYFRQHITDIKNYMIKELNTKEENTNLKYGQ